MTSTKLERELSALKRKERQDSINRSIDFVKQFIPELRPEFFVEKKRFWCKIGHHKHVTVGKKRGGPWADLCIFCGYAIYAWCSGGGFEGPRVHSIHVGYGDPNIKRKICS